MIANDQELNATLERIRHLQSQVAHLRQVETNPANYHLSASGFLARLPRCPDGFRARALRNPVKFRGAHAEIAKVVTNLMGSWLPAPSATGRGE